MAYKPRAVRRLAKKSKRSFIITLSLIVILGYLTIAWILPAFIGAVGSVKNIVKPPKVITKTEFSNVAPPTLNIYFEATNSSQLDIAGYATPNSKVKLFLDDNLEETVDVSPEGTFIVENIALNLGANNLYGKTVDEKDNESLPSKTIKLLFDNEKPTLSINEPEDDKKIQGGDKKVKISGKTEPEAQVFINDSRVIVDKDGNFSSEQTLNDGDNTFTVKAQDSAANYHEVQRKVTYTP